MKTLLLTSMLFSHHGAADISTFTVQHRAISPDAANKAFAPLREKEVKSHGKKHEVKHQPKK